MKTSTTSTVTLCLVLCMAWPEAVSQAKPGPNRPSQNNGFMMALAWPGILKAKAAGSGHGFNPIKFSSKILKKFHFESFFVCGIVYTDVEEVFWIVKKFMKKKLLKLLVLIHIPKGLGLGQARPRPSHV